MEKFDERKKSFEKKFAHDEELKFKVASRRNKYLGQWTSQKLGYDAEKEKEYAKHIGWPTNQEPSKPVKIQRDKPSQWVKSQTPKKTPPTTKNLDVEKTSRRIKTIPVTCP